MLKYRVIESTIKSSEFNKRGAKKTIVLIREYTTDTGEIIRIPSCINSYLLRWKHKSTNVCRNAAFPIAAFLNFLIRNVNDGNDTCYDDLRKKGLYGLKLSHAARFLNYCIDVNGISLKTSHNYANSLLNFYRFLDNKKIINDNSLKLAVYPEPYSDVSENTHYMPVSSNSFKLFSLPDSLVYFPDKAIVKLNKLVNLEERFWKLFIEVSQSVSPEITFGIVLQIFGGLRRGEVVNITLPDVRFPKIGKRNDANIIIKDRKSELFKDRLNIEIDKCEVKSPRKQLVIDFDGKLQRYFNQHIKIRDRLSIKNNSTTSALFLDDNGQAMCGSTYDKAWMKVKQKFMNIVSQNDYIAYMNLKEYSWRTHIGRGIFTNLCLEYGLAKTVRELANLRGDISTDSSQAYIDDFEKRGIIKKSLNIMSES